MGGYLDEQCLKCDISFVFSEQFSEIARRRSRPRGSTPMPPIIFLGSRAYRGELPGLDHLTDNTHLG